MAAESLNQLWSRAIVEELVRSGVRHVVVCPGSRSTPLALAFAASPEVRTWSIIDERSGAFFALGLAKATGVPAVVLATSGSAGAHFHPAVIEAAMGHVPLIAITADRPHELQGWGAPQTIPQARLFGEFARTYVDLGMPEATAPALLHLRASVCRAYATATRAPRGAVHLNAPFREPLAPPAHPEPLPDLPERAVLGADGGGPLVRMPGPRRAVDPAALTEVRGALERSARGVIVVGPRDASDGLAEALIALGHAWGYPVLAEATSNVRYGHVDDVVCTTDALLRHKAFAATHVPEVVLRFGGGLTPKTSAAWLDASGARTFVFSDDGAPVDPTHAAEWILEGDPVAAARALCPPGQRRQTEYAASFRAAELRARAAIAKAFDGAVLTEPRVAFEVARALPAGANLFVSSSMPIRDLDAFASIGGAFRVFANRGANGIDGISSSALGVAAASGRPTTLLTGDLAFLHDLGGLMAARRHSLDLTVVVVNNDGGGIFSFLPVAGRTDRFEELFGTPHGLDLAQAAKLFEARYVRCADAAALRGALSEASEGGLRVLEVRTDRTENVRVHQALFAEIAAALGDGKWL